MRETGGARRSPVGRRRGHEHRAQGKGRAGVFRPVDVVPCRVVRDGRLLLLLRLRDGVRDGTGEGRKTRGMGASRRMRSSARVRVRVLARVPVRMLSLRLPRGAREDSTYRGPALAGSIHTSAWNGHGPGLSQGTDGARRVFLLQLRHTAVPCPPRSWCGPKCSHCSARTAGV